MPAARHSPAVLNHRSTLTVAGGNTGHARHTRTSVIEVFREETSQWHTTEPLPFPWRRPSSLLINNRWYLLGGVAKRERSSNQAFADRDSTSNSAWEVLSNTPHYGPAAATFDKSLLAVGGIATDTMPLKPQSAVHVYSPSTNAWIHISDLPAPQMESTTAMLSPTELLVIGGWNNSFCSSVYKGLLRIE